MTAHTSAAQGEKANCSPQDTCPVFPPEREEQKERVDLDYSNPFLTIRPPPPFSSGSITHCISHPPSFENPPLPVSAGSKHNMLFHAFVLSSGSSFCSECPLLALSPPTSLFTKCVICVTDGAPDGFR